MKKRSIGCNCSCEAVCDECSGCVGLECSISDISGWKSSKTVKVQTGSAECVDGDFRIPVGTADGTGLYRNSNGSVIPSGDNLYITFDGLNCGRNWTSSWYGQRTDPSDFTTYTEALAGNFNCNTCSGAQTGVATQFFWEEDGVAICTFTGTGCGGNPDTNVCDAPDDDCAATDQICEKVSITSFTAENDHATRTFEFDQVAGFKPHWYDSKTGLVPCTVVYTDSGTPSNSYTRLGFVEIDGLPNSYSNKLRMYAGELQVLADADPDGYFTESSNPCSGTHSGDELCETALLGLLGDMEWSYSQVSNECADEPSQNCCASANCGYTGITAFQITDTDQFGGTDNVWVMNSYTRTGSCQFTMSMTDTSVNNRGTINWTLAPNTFSGGAGDFNITGPFLGPQNNSDIVVNFTSCNLVQSVNGTAGFATVPVTATFIDSGTCT